MVRKCFGLSTKKVLNTFIMACLVTLIFFFKNYFFQKEFLNLDGNEMVPALPDFDPNPLESEDEIVFFGELNEKEVRLNREMFFLVSSGMKDLHLNEACMIEAAARGHPTRRIFVLFITPEVNDVFKSKSMSALLSYENIFLRYIKLKKYMVNPFVKKWFLDSNFQKTKFSEKFLNDALTYVILDKFGGTVLDFDAIFINQLPFEKNFFSRCSDDSLLPRPISLNSRHPVLGDLFSSLVNSYDPENPESLGSDLLTKQLKKMCQVDFIKELLFKECTKSAWIMPVNMICPIPERRSNLIFNPLKAGVVQKELNSSLSVALKLWTEKWHKDVKRWGGPNLTTIFWNLSETSCPIMRQISVNGF